VTDKEKQLQELALEVYKEQGRYLVPFHPWILIRVLPKSQTYKGLLVLPEKQNKTCWESIVLSTWKPFTRTHKIKDVFCDKTEQSEFTPGDHILIPHWAGLPVSGLDEDLYRIIREPDIHAWLEIEIETTESKLKRVLANHSIYAKEIMDRFVLVDKEQQSVTMSGV